MAHPLVKFFPPPPHFFIVRAYSSRPGEEHPLGVRAQREWMRRHKQSYKDSLANAMARWAITASGCVAGVFFFSFFFIVSKVFYSFIFHVFSCCPVSFSLSLLFFPVLEKRFSLFPPLLLSFPCPPPHPPPPQRLCGHHQAAAQAGDLSVWRGLVPDQLRSEVSRRFRSNNATRSCFSPRSPPTSPAQSQRHPRPLGAALCDGADSRMRHVADVHPLRQSGAGPLVLLLFFVVIYLFTGL